MDKKLSGIKASHPQSDHEASLTKLETYARGAVGVIVAGLLILVSNGFVVEPYLCYAVLGGLVVFVLHLYKPTYSFLLVPTGAWYTLLIYGLLHLFDPYF
jgi:hypothetical protein